MQGTVLSDDDIDVPQHLCGVAPFPADLDLDGDADGNDFLIWQTGFDPMTSGAIFTDGDANFDGNVDDDDMVIWESFFGQSAPLQYVTLAPEPSSAALMATVALMISCRRWCLTQFDPRSSIMLAS